MPQHEQLINNGTLLLTVLEAGHAGSLCQQVCILEQPAPSAVSSQGAEG